MGHCRFLSKINSQRQYLLFPIGERSGIKRNIHAELRIIILPAHSRERKLATALGQATLQMLVENSKGNKQGIELNKILDGLA